MARPEATEYPPFFSAYVDLVVEPEVLPILEQQTALLRRMIDGVSPERETFAYAPGKWTVRQVIGHMGDVERVFGFRAFAFSRAEAAPLPGFDENAYVDRSQFLGRSLAEHVEDFAAIRGANVRLLKALSDEQWSLGGTANGKQITVRALAFGMAGHARHHLNILEHRYGFGL
jgi:hypothetical protein